MKFTTAWAQVESQNHLLKYTHIVLVFIILILAVLVLKFAFKNPIVIERSSDRVEVKSISDIKVNEKDFLAYLEAILKNRYDYEVEFNPYLYSEAEIQKYQIERKEFQEKKLKQRVLINSVKMDGNNFVADIDRIISIEKVKSVINQKIKLTVISNPRTELNPYGLILENIEILKDEKNNN